MKKSEDNRKIIRRYIRTIAQSQKATKSDYNKSIKFYTILHNALLLEDMYYDQFMISNCQINKHLILHEHVQFAYTMKVYAEKMSERLNPVRLSMDKCLNIEEVKLYIKSNKDFYNKLILKTKQEQL